MERASAADFIQVRGTRRTVMAEIRTAGGESTRLELDVNAVAPGYFGTLGLSLLRGRDFEPRDLGDAPRVAIVSRAMADALWRVSG